MRLNIHNLGSVKTNPMQGLFWDICGALPFALIQVAFLPACFASLPLFHVWDKYNMHSMHCFFFQQVFFTGAQQVGSGSVGMVTSLPLRRVLPPLLLPLWHQYPPIIIIIIGIICVLDSVIVCSFVEKGYYFVHQNCAPF